MEEMSKLAWLIGLVKHAIWAHSLYFLYLLLLSVSKTLASFQPTLWPFHGHVGLVWTFLEDLWRMFMESHGKRSTCFANVASATFTGNATDALCHLLRISYRPGLRERTPKSVFSFEDCFYVVSIRYALELLWNTFNIWDIQITQRLFFLIRMTATLWINESMKLWG
jgi:hypothetical protein